MNNSTIFKAVSVFLLLVLTVSFSQAQYGGLHIETSTEKTCVGNNVRFTIETDSWNSVTSCQFTLEWDPSKLEYITHSTVNPTFSDILYGDTQTENGKLTCSWLDQAVEGISVTDQVFFEIVLKAISDDSEPVEIFFSNSSAVIEFTHTNSDDETFPYDPLLVNGNVELNANPTVSDVNVQDASLNQSNGSITVVPDSGVGPYSVVWDNGSMGTTVTNLAPGDYKCTVSDVNDCASVNGPYAVEMMVNTTNAIASLNTFSILPNPASDFTTINVSYERPEKTAIRIIDVTGKIMYTNEQIGAAFSIDIPLDQFSNGTYFIEIATEDGIAVERLVVAR